MGNHKKSTALICRVIAMLMIMASAWMGEEAHPSQRAASNRAETQTRESPLALLAERIEERLAIPITYEDPALIWSGDLVATKVVNGITLSSKYLWPKPLTFSLPEALNSDTTQMPDAALLEEALIAYRQQTDGPRFTMFKSKLGLHIIPDQVRDATGRFVTIVPLLDTVITIPIARRTPYEHLVALCSAISATTGIDIKLNSAWIVQWFAPNGIVPPKLMKEKDIEQASFDWGATGLGAREALLTLLDLSSTTLTWRLLYQPAVLPQDCFYVLTITPIQQLFAGTDGELVKMPLTYDRCRDKPCARLPK